MKETVQDSRYENLVRLLDKMGDRLANVVDVVEDFQRKQSSRNGDRDQSRETTRIEIEERINKDLEQAKDT